MKENGQIVEENNQVNWKVGLAYGLPNFCMAIMIGPALGVLQGVYAKDFGLTLESMAGVILLGRIFDAISDPLVGISSDKFRHRFWGRRSWLVAGAIISLISLYHLFIPPAGGMTITHFRIWFILGFLGWTVSEVPYLAWGTEITEDYDQRTKIFSFKTATGLAGSLVFLSLPLIIFYYNVNIKGMDADTQTGDFSPLTLKVAFGLLAITLPIFVITALKVCPDGFHVKNTTHRSFKDTLIILLTNKAMLLFCIAFMFIGIAAGMQISMAYLHLSVYLQLGEDVSKLYVCGLAFSLIGVPVWNWLAKVKGKHISFITGLAFTGAFFVVLGLMEPDNGGKLIFGKVPVFWQYLVTYIVFNFCSAVFYSLPPAMIGDIAEYGMLKTRQDQTGTYYSIYTFLYKSMIGIGGAAAMFIAGAVFGFDATSDVQNDTAALGLKIMMGFLPAVLVAIAVIILLRYPITKAKYLDIQAQIHELGLKTTDDQ